MKITTIAQLMEFETLIGKENVGASKKLLEDGGELWIFRTSKELKESDLSEKEKEKCEKRFAETSGKYAGWYRPPAKSREYIPGFTVHKDYNAHGNYRVSSGDGLNYQWSH